jgi:hypothetical protein
MFKLIEFVERRYRTPRVRRWIARFLLRKIYRLREVWWTADRPVLTTLFVSSPHTMKKAKKKLGEALEALCACGSGRRLKDCHSGL